MIKNLTINRKSGEPVSTQIAKYLRLRIRGNELKPGDKLPTTLEAVQLAGIGGQTFRKAINVLEKEGLVESSPRRGTFVKSTPTILDLRIQAREDHKKSSKLVCFAIMSAMAPTKINPRPILYKPDTTAGLLKECERQGVIAQVFPSELRNAIAEDVYKTIMDWGCKAVVWPTPTDNEWPAIKYLQSRSVPVVVTSRSRLNMSLACIESDYDQAGLEAGEHLIKNGCSSVFLLSHFSDSSEQKSNLPYGIRQGLLRAMEKNGLDTSICLLEKEYPQLLGVGNEIMADIERHGKEVGIVFTNGFEFLDLLNSQGERARDLLAGKEIIILSNRDISLQLTPLMGKLNPMVLVDPFEDVGRMAVQKARSVIDGYLEDTTTLVKIKFMRFNDLNLLSIHQPTVSRQIGAEI